MMHMLYNLLINYYNFILAHFRACSARTFNFTIIPIIFIYYYHYNKYIIINMNIFNHYLPQTQNLKIFSLNSFILHVVVNLDIF